MFFLFSASILFLGLASSVFVVWYKLTGPIVIFCWILTALFAYFLNKFFRDHDRSWWKMSKIGEIKMDWMLILYGLSWFLTFYFLSISTYAMALQSPWQAINKWYLPVFFISTLIFGIIMSRGYATKTLIFLVCAHSFLLHLYLPMSHKLPWGGDVWRHIGVENILAEQKPYLPVLFGSEAKWRPVGSLGISLPEALLIPNKYAYGQLWGLSVLLHRTFGLNLVTINIWLIPILWSIFLPLLLFKIGKLLFNQERKALFFSILSLLPFPLQALGGLTLPISLGFLTFFFAIWLWMEYWDEPKKIRFWFAFVFSLLMTFSYPLFALYIWLFVDAQYVNNALKKKTHKVRSILSICYLLLAICYLPIIELLAHTSSWPSDWDVLSQLKNLLVQFSGWNVVFPKSYDVASGNIIFNQAPAELAFDLLKGGTWVFPVLLLIWLGAGYGVILTWKKRFEKSWGAFLYLFASVFFGYIVSWYFLAGEHNFARRLDPLFALLIILFFCVGLFEIIDRYKNFVCKKNVQRIFIGFGIIIFSFTILGTYRSGPDMFVSDVGVYDAAVRLWEYERGLGVSTNYCVLGSTENLLVVEGVSGRAVVGGGFTIDVNFAQPARIKFFEEFTAYPTQELIEKFKKETSADHCWLLMSNDSLADKEGVAQLSSWVYGTPSITLYYIEGLKKN